MEDLSTPFLVPFEYVYVHSFGQHSKTEIILENLVTPCKMGWLHPTQSSFLCGKGESMFWNCEQR